MNTIAAVPEDNFQSMKERPTSANYGGKQYVRRSY